MIQKSWRDYIKLNSLTWWAGVALILLGVMSIEGITFFGSATILAFAKAFMGSAEPVYLIGNGLAFIGLRAQLGRL